MATYATFRDSRVCRKRNRIYARDRVIGFACTRRYVGGGGGVGWGDWGENLKIKTCRNMTTLGCCVKSLGIPIKSTAAAAVLSAPVCSVEAGLMILAANHALRCQVVHTT